MLSICLLLRWGAMDAEAYPEASTNVLQILWGISTSTFPSQQFQWEKAKISALEALAQYEVYFCRQFCFIILRFLLTTAEGEKSILVHY